MKDLLQKIIFILKTYKWILLPTIPAVILVVFLVVITFSTPQANEKTNQLSPSPSPVYTVGHELVPPEAIAPPEEVESMDGEEITALPEYKKTESLSDGSSVYYFDSGIASRPNIIIQAKTGETVFTRTVFIENTPQATINRYKSFYGEPEKVIQGSVFGASTAVFITSSHGVTYIADPKTGKVFEEQSFKPMSVAEYLKLYGDKN